MADEKDKREPGHEHTEMQHLDEAELAKDLEITDPEEADAVKGGEIEDYSFDTN
jgi:hypothetical protein